MLAGPDWSNSMMDAKKLQWWLKTVQAARPALSMVTVHHYGGDIINDKNIAGIIADARMVGSAMIRARDGVSRSGRPSCSTFTCLNRPAYAPAKKPTHPPTHPPTNSTRS
jgi:hypothetical protein